MPSWFRWLVIAVVVVVTALGCIGGKRTRGPGTNLGSGSDYEGPWTEGGRTPAHTGP